MSVPLQSRAVAHIAALPSVRPFIGPEEIARNHGFDSLLRLGANESSFGPSPAAIDAMRREAPRASWYGDPESYDLRTTLAAGSGCSIDNIVVGAGIDDLMGLAVRAFAGLGGVAVWTRGTYPTFAYHAGGYGASLAGVPYTERGTVDVQGLIDAARAHDAALVYVANPDNPSGSLASAAEIAHLVREVPARTVVLLDEAYADFVAPDALYAGELEDRVIRLRTFSKAYGLAGLRIGYALSSAGTIAELCKVRLQYGVSRLAQAAAEAALSDGAFLRDVVAQTAAGRVDYAALGSRFGLPVFPSSTNFVLFDVRTPERAVALLRSLENEAIFIRKPGSAPLDRCIRVTVGTPAERSRFASALERCMRALA